MTADSARARSAYDEISDPATLRRLLEASLLLESNLQLSRLLGHIVEEARSLVNARYGVLVVLDDDGQETVEFHVSGLHPDEEAALRRGPLPTGMGVLGLVVADPRPVRIPRIADHPDRVGFPPDHPPMSSFLGAPIRVRDQVYGNIYLTDKTGADEFSADDEAVIGALALTAGIAVENARLQERTRDMAVYEERDRMARDLHDGVIQRLFAIGLTVQGLATAQFGRAVASNLSTVVEDIDETIRRVRATIFELGNQGRGNGIRSDVLAVVGELRPVIGFDVTVEFIGPVEAAVSDEIADHLIATLRESLSNVARHAQAGRAHVFLSADGGSCRLEVADDGLGFTEPPAPGSGGMGLRNLRRRAESMGGSFEVRHPADGGTTVVWTVPTPDGPSPTPR